MKTLILTNYFPPEIGAASHLFYELAETLVGLGDKVTVVTGFPRYNVKELPEKYRGKLFFREQMNGIEVVRLLIPSLPRGIPMVRGLEHLLVGLMLFLGGLVVRRHHVTLVYSPPLTIGLSAWLLGTVKRTPFIFNVQDIFPQYAIDAGILKSRTLIRFFQRMEKFIYRKARYVTVHSDGNRQHLLAKGVPADKIVVVHNWVDTDFITPRDKHNSFHRENKLNGKFIVSFAGTMGFVQDIDTIIEAAHILMPHQQILFLLVGDGVQREAMEKKARRLGLTNVKFLPLQPRTEYPAVLNASDVGLVALIKEVSTPVVPSKLLSIMASGRPAVASLPLSGDAPKIVEAAECGYCVEPGNPQALAQAILDLYKNPALREQLGSNGRHYAEQNFSKQACARQYEALFQKAGGFERSSRLSPTGVKHEEGP